MHRDLETAFGIQHRNRRSGEGVVNSIRERVGVANFLDGLQRRGHVSAIVSEYRCVRADLRQARRSLRVGAEVIVKTPRSNLLTQSEHFGCIFRIGKLRHHAVEARELISEHLPLSVLAFRTNYRSMSIDE